MHDCWSIVAVVDVPVVCCRAVRAFQQVLYVDPVFQRANEVHLRLGLMFKVNNDPETALKHLKLSYVDASPSTFCKLESEYMAVVVQCNVKLLRWMSGDST